MTNFGDPLTDAEVDEMLRISDLEGDGFINYEGAISLLRILLVLFDQNCSYGVITNVDPG